MQQKLSPMCEDEEHMEARGRQVPYVESVFFANTRMGTPSAPSGAKNTITERKQVCSTHIIIDWPLKTASLGGPSVP